MPVQGGITIDHIDTMGTTLIILVNITITITNDTIINGIITNRTAIIQGTYTGIKLSTTSTDSKGAKEASSSDSVETLYAWVAKISDIFSELVLLIVAGYRPTSGFYSQAPFYFFNKGLTTGSNAFCPLSLP